jgi:hypothetical protein
MGESDLASFLWRMDAWLARGQRFGLLIDSRGASGMSPEQRAALIAHMKSRAAITTRVLVQAVVLDSLLQRTLFYAVNLLFPNPFPSKIFGDPEAARLWLSAELARLSSETR